MKNLDSRIRPGLPGHDLVRMVRFSATLLSWVVTGVGFLLAFVAVNVLP